MVIRIEDSFSGKAEKVVNFCVTMSSIATQFYYSITLSESLRVRAKVQKVPKAMSLQLN